MLLGGKLTDGKRRPTSVGNGMGSVGTRSDGAKEIRIAKGDVLIIAAGTPHRWLMADEFTSYTVVRINGHITYVEVRFPGNVMTKK